MTEDESEPPPSSAPQERRTRATTRRMILLCVIIFGVALGVRALHWQDNRQLFPFEGMTGEYKQHALLLVRGDLTRFLRGNDPPSDADTVKHPPGYPLFIAAVYALCGESDTALRLAHIIIDSLAAVLVVVVAAELLPLSAAAVAGLLVALSPQLAYHSIMLLPDPLATPPLLLAVYLLIRAAKRPRLSSVVAAGALVGVSCWLRANAMLLPLFLAACVPLLFERGRRLGYAAALVAASLVLFAPVTIRNAVAFGHFIPLSLSAGITLVEGIGIYDTEGRFGLPSSDYAVTKWEAQEFNRPDYLGTRFKPDGVARERHRLQRGFAVIRAHPFWFARVMAHRGLSMLRLARVELVAAQPATTRPLDLALDEPPDATLSPSQLSAQDNSMDNSMPGANEATTQTRLTLDAEGRALRVESDAAGSLFVSPPLQVREGTDYLLRLPLKIEQGSVRIEVVNARREADVLASSPILHPVNWLDLTPDTQPAVVVTRPFVSGDVAEVRVVLRNGGRGRARVVAEAGGLELFALGRSSYAWTRYPRLLIRGVQSLFLTATMLPFAILGAFWLARARGVRYVALLLVVPVYYMCVQSALWSEFRYVLAMYYFLFILFAAGLYRAAVLLRDMARRLSAQATTTRAPASTRP